jgi:trimethylamine--corrinoid protein Co-methyltransferase
MRRALQPITVNERTLALEVIQQIGIGGNYLQSEHTLEHFREELFLSDLFETMSWASAHDQELHGMETKALEMAQSIWDEEPHPVIDKEKIKEIDKVVSHAEHDFTG